MRDEGLIDDRNSDRYVIKGTQRLNEVGRLYASQLLMGKVLDNVADLEDMGQEYRNRYNAQLPVIVAAGQSNKAFDLTDALKRSAALIAAMQRAGIKNPTDAIAQRRLVDEGGHATLSADHPVWNDPLAQAVTLAVLGPQKEVGPKFREFARLAAQPSSAGGMFDDGPTDEQRAMEAMKRAFGFKSDHPFAEKMAADEAAAREKKLTRRKVKTAKRLEAKGVKTQAETEQAKQEQEKVA